MARTLLALLAVVVGYHVAFVVPKGGAAILLALPPLFTLASVRSQRAAVYLGALAGLLVFGPQLWFFTKVFGPAGAVLWLIAAAPFALVVGLLRLTRLRLGNGWRTVLLTAVIWTGVEFFRSELYYFKFAWLLPGQAVAFMPGVWMNRVGVYGLGFVFALVSGMVVGGNRRLRIAGVVAVAIFVQLMYSTGSPDKPHGGPIVAGVQLEFPTEATVVQTLDQLAVDHPNADIWVLSEYTFHGPVPESVRRAVARHKRYLVVGATHPLTGDDYFDAAIVVGPDGRDVFWQAKSVPVQLALDGRAADERRVWQSPWGKIGLAVCYDIGYTRPLDDFVRQGAVALIVPTMDLQQWGGYQRRMLHGRCAPVRAAEYGIPVFGVWSSGVSQLTDRVGRVVAAGSYPGQGDVIVGTLDTSHVGHIPPDRPLAWACVIGTAGWMVMLWVHRFASVGTFLTPYHRTHDDQRVAP